ncbi:MAG: cupin domain-containing protein [Gammaproteobacteria bacterium]
MRAINFREKFAQFDELWSPRIVARMNDSDFKLVRIKGEFEWHSHSDTDEVFVVLDGQLVLEMRAGPVTIGSGEMFVVPAGVEHRPVAREECRLLLIEKQDTSNTGDQPGASKGKVGMPA